MAGEVGLAGEGDGLPNEELGAVAGYEDSWVDGYAQTAELRPPEDMFERHASDSPVDHGGEVGRCPRRRDEQPRLVLGEHTAGSPKPADDDGSRAK